MRPVTMRGLEVFVAVVDTGGFGSAASALDITQPSVSVHMRELESKVGGPLFERHPGVSPQLTPVGRNFYAYAVDTLARTRAISSDAGQSKRKLHFAAQRFVANALLRRPLEEFTSLRTQVELIVRTGTFEEVHALFLKGAVDLVFMLSNGEVPGLQTEQMGRYRLAFVAPPNHPLAKAQNISIDTLSAYPFVAAYERSYFGRMITDKLRAVGLTDPIIASQAQEMGTVRDMVVAGMGIACALRRALQPDIAAGSLVELDVDVEPMYLTLNYARRVRPELPEIDNLIDMMRRSEGLHA
ncbi:LysR family transcriptional regulator [Paraburkholderia fungorum]|jgi:DNA-binding transcriptional LysR family regulator|uniref:LysR family transcriptional regulator n=1 Tax=Paraburkholderia fungorum TaxID=134537 RepID=UPI0038B94CBE